MNRHNIRPALFNEALDELKKMNSLYKDVPIDETCESVSKENDLSLWNMHMLTNEKEENDKLQTDSDNDYTAQEYAENKDQSKNGSVTAILRHPSL